MLALVGVPGIYFHSLFGSRSWREGAGIAGQNRTINRQKFDLNTFEGELGHQASLRHRVFAWYARLLQARSASPAFHPHGVQRVLDYGRAMFALLRISPDGAEQVLCLNNISDQPQRVNALSILGSAFEQALDLITGQRIQSPFRLDPYQTLWLRMRK
jgi:glucosylglycerate phosphorylase